MTRKRVVLDTNIVISALLFRGPLSRIHAFWKREAFNLVASKEIVEEYISVLAYPKFRLTKQEIETLLQVELLPYVEPVIIPAELKRVCLDPDDDKFLACARTAKADAIVSGGKHLLSLKARGMSIISAEAFLSQWPKDL